MTFASNNFKKSRLKNGLEVYTEEVPGFRSIALGFWVRTGSRHEKPEQAGISHFIEHLIFKGSARYSAQDISTIFDNLGGEINAFTGKEYTCYYFRLLDEHFDKGFEVLTEILQNPLFKPEDIESERKVILEEIAMYEDTPDEKIHDLFLNNLFEGHPLGKSIIGDAETVKGLTRKDLLNYFENYYHPSNIVLAASGSLKHDELLKKLKNYWVKNNNCKTEFQPFKVKTSQKVALNYKKTEQIHLCLGVETFNARHPERYTLAVFDTILGKGMSSRLFQEIREKRGLAYSIFSYSSLFNETGAFVIYAGTNKKNVQDVVNLILEQVYSLAEKGPVKEELEKAKNQIKSQLVLSLESTSARMNRIGRTVMAKQKLLSLDKIIEKVDQVSAEKVKNLAQKIFQPSRIVVTAIGPLKGKKIKIW